MSLVTQYYWLAKPGIVYGNLIATMAGFFLASSIKGLLDIGLLMATLVGVTLVIGSACVFNNHIDRDIDKLMERTKKRASATGQVSGQALIVYASILGILGFTVLLLYTSWLAVGLVGLAYVAYIIFYGIAKRHSVHGTLVGTISGALPPVVGYVVVAGSVDVAAVLIFLIMVCWQMPHFYAIAMRRRQDYAAAKIPVLPVVSGMRVTKIQMLFYIAAFILLNSLLVMTGYVGYAYLIVMTGVGVVWLLRGIKGFETDNGDLWARRMFFFSLTVLLTFCLMLAVGGLLP
jgi:protoheme IX farnesyltransferase